MVNGNRRATLRQSATRYFQMKKSDRIRQEWLTLSDLPGKSYQIG